MDNLNAAEILAIANGLITVAGNVAGQIAKLKALAAQAGASKEQLDALDIRLTAALDARTAEQ